MVQRSTAALSLSCLMVYRCVKGAYLNNMWDLPAIKDAFLPIFWSAKRLPQIPGEEVLLHERAIQCFVAHDQKFWLSEVGAKWLSVPFG